MIMPPLVLLIFSAGVINWSCIEAFIDSKGLEPVCPDITCNNNGTLQEDTCTCVCTQEYSGIFCETELRPTRWPTGNYSLLSSVFGCPENDNYSWYKGYINMTIPTTTLKQQWKMPVEITNNVQITFDPHILGPYHYWSLQLNFCTRHDDIDISYNDNVTNDWPSGDYCLFQKGENCPIGFDISTTTLGGYNVTRSDTDGTLPEVTFNNTSKEVTLMMCCRQDGRSEPLNLPNVYPFIMMKVNTSDCDEVIGMTVHKERFDLIDENNLFKFQGNLSIFTKDENFQRMGLCYYQHSAIHECYHVIDNGWSYGGTVNQSIYGEPCLYWATVKDIFIPNREYVGDLSNNFCRLTFPWGDLVDSPRCYVNRTGQTDLVLELCNISLCDVDTTLEEIGTFKPVYSVNGIKDRIPEYAVDGELSGNPFQGDRPMQKPWLQVDLEEMLEVHQILVHRRYVWFPVNFRFVSTHISPLKWDFFNYGSLQCEERKNPRRAWVYLFKCYRPVIGQYVTVRNFDDTFTNNGWGKFYFMEISEILIYVKRTVCGRRLGMLSGAIRDFQLSGSYQKSEHEYDLARLLLPGTGFRSEDNYNVYFMVDLIAPTVVMGIEMMSGLNGQEGRFIDEFTIDYATTQYKFVAYADNRGVNKIFKIDSSQPLDMIQRYMLTKHFISRYLKINAFSYKPQQHSFKLEVIGCPKQVSRDLQCDQGSMDYGYDVVEMAGFWMERLTLLNINTTACKAHCEANNCTSYYTKLGECTIYTTSRYNPHFSHWYITKLTAGQVRTKLCIKEIRSVQECDRTITEPGLLESPSYPFYYGELLSCSWTINFPDTFVKFDIIDIQLARPDTPLTLREIGITSIKPGRCTDTLTVDGLVITSENQHIYKGAVLFSNSSTMHIKFKSCARYSRTNVNGFMINITYSDIPSCWSVNQDCASTCTSGAAIITSPGYPCDILPPTSCKWTIQGVTGQYAQLSFSVINIASEGSMCDDAYIEVFDISLFGVKTLVNRYCSVNAPINPIKSSWQYLELKFTSGDLTSRNGFIAEYSLINFVQDEINDTSEGCGSWRRFGYNCYSVIQNHTGLTWLSAESQCKDHGGHLVSLTSQQEVTFLHYMLTHQYLDRYVDALDFYIGLRKIGNQGRFQDYQWSDGSPATFTAWYIDKISPRLSQPDGLDNERCTLLRLYSIHSTDNWHDVACAYNKIYNFICERKADDYIKKATTLPIPDRSSNSSSTGSLMRSLFACSSTEYILSIYVCDGQKDCYDGSDELSCDEDCGEASFVCDNSQCISAGLHCDFQNDCGDDSDEINCAYPKCVDNEWRCHSGQCIPLQHRCDVKRDCFDQSDEQMCDSCQSPSFQCYDQRCITGSRVCDGYNDCSGLLYEDEDKTCTRNTRSSCLDWYNIGKRNNGSYLIDLETNVGFEVECRFIAHGEVDFTIETVLHHQYETPLTWTEGVVDMEPFYTANPEQIELLMTQNECVQYFSHECSFDEHNIYWLDKNLEEQSNRDYTTGCNCPYVEQCDAICTCNYEGYDDWYDADLLEFRQDAGYISNHDRIPIHSVHSTALGDIFGGQVRITLGPVICRQELDISTTSLSDMIVCENNDLAPATSVCLLDFDKFGEIIGCRDLSHLHRDCEVLECGEGEARCSPSGYCIPRRLVCDGIRHCPDGGDEKGCSQTLDKILSCAGSYSCHLSNVCIDLIQLCDGLKQCPYGDDELLCDDHCPVGCTCELFAMFCTDTESIKAANYSTSRKSDARVLKIEQQNLQITNNTLSLFPLLNHLYIARCNLNMLEPYMFHYNLNLIVLDVSYNKIQVLLENTFRGLFHLNVLNFKGNPLKLIQIGAFSDLRSLPKLDLSHSFLSAVEENIFTGLDSLRTLNLSWSLIHTIKSDVLDNLNALEKIDIYQNDITNFDKGIFKGLHNLKEIFTSSYLICCVRPEHVIEENCFSPKNEFSSCDDLMRNEILRAFLWIIGLCALLGNIFVIGLRLAFDKAGLNRPYGMFVTNLSIVDFVMGVYLIILAIADTLFRGQYVWNDYSWRNGAACQIAGVLSTIASEGSVVFLCFITLDRFLVVKFPFGNFRISRKTGIAMCTIAWIVIVVISIVPLTMSSYFDGLFYSRSPVCLALPLTRDRPPGWHYGVAVFIVFNLLAFGFIAVVQVVIYREIKACQGKIASQRRRKDMVIARKLFLVAITDFMCWFPVGLMGILALNGHVISGDVYAWIAVFVLPINSALNPFLYTFGSNAMKAVSLRQSSKKTAKRVLSAGGTSVTNVFNSNLFEFGTKNPGNKTSLQDLLGRRNIHVSEALLVSVTLVRCLNTLHSSCMVNGNLTDKRILVQERSNKISGVVLKSSPKPSDEENDYVEDILQYGRVIKLMLKNISKTGESPPRYF